MFRQGIRRCSRLGSVSTPTSILLQSRALPIARQVGAVPSRLALPLRSVTHAFRAYSSEAAAEKVESPADAVSENVEAFAELEKLGVHRNLLDAIIKDMGYENMTPVQAKTINPALKGTDM